MAPTQLPKYGGLHEPAKLFTWAVGSFAALLFIGISLGFPVDAVAATLLLVFGLAAITLFAWFVMRPQRKRELW